MTIRVIYSSSDGFRKSRTFKTAAAARKFATYWVGETPDLGHTYAMSFDGIGKIQVEGIGLRELFERN